MHTAIRIRNFRGFESLSVESLANITLVSGANGVGKSSILEALFLHANGALAGNAALSVLQAARGELAVNLEQFEESTPWDGFFSRYDTSNPIVLSGVLDQRRIELELAAVPGEVQQQTTFSISSPGASRKESRQLRVSLREDKQEASYLNSANIELSTPANQGGLQFQNFSVQLEVRPEAQPLIAAHYVAARNRSPHNQIADRFSRLRRRGREKDFVNALRALEPRLREVEILTSQGAPMLHLDVGTDLAIPLGLMGGGIHAVADLMGVVGETRNGLILVDEIENGIHHSALANLWVSLSRLAERNNNQIVATTHSRECVAAAWQALGKRGPRFLRLLQLRRRPGNQGEIVASEYDENMLQSGLEMDLELR